MSVDAESFRSNGTSWGGKRKASADLKASPLSHAERLAYNMQAGGSSVYRVDQNAFPCPQCHQFFINQTTGKTTFGIVMKCEGNQGGYQAGHTPVAAAVPPVVIYYYNGAAHYGAAPANFPAHPAV